MSLLSSRQLQRPSIAYSRRCPFWSPLASEKHDQPPDLPLVSLVLNAVLDTRHVDAESFP